MAKGMLRADAFTLTPARMTTDPDRVARDLEEAVRVMAQGPELEQNLVLATERVKADVSDENLLAQNRALVAHRNHLDRLAELGQSEDIV